MPQFKNVIQYWEERYREGLTSGSGSSGVLADYKARTVNDFVNTNGVESVIEWGCGDGAQLKLSSYPKTLGLDVSKKSIENCKSLFKNDSSKSFMLYSPMHFQNIGNFIGADLGLSLDVIYHLVEDEIYEKYMNDLFDCSLKYVLIYSSNTNEQSDAPHVKHRKFSDWINNNRDDFKFDAKFDNPHFPFDSSRPDTTTFAEFYLFSKK